MYKVIYDKLNRYEKDKWNKAAEELLAKAGEGGYLRVARNTYDEGRKEEFRFAVKIVEVAKKKGLFAKGNENIFVEFRTGEKTPVFETKFAQIFVAEAFLQAAGLPENELELGIYEAEDMAQLKAELNA